MANKILDDQKDAWPVTGHWCNICGWPADYVLEEFDYRHPMCLWNGGHRG